MFREFRNPGFMEYGQQTLFHLQRYTQTHMYICVLYVFIYIYIYIYIYMYIHMDFHVCKLGEVFLAAAGNLFPTKMTLLGLYGMYLKYIYMYLNVFASF